MTGKFWFASTALTLIGAFWLNASSAHALTTCDAGPPIPKSQQCSRSQGKIICQGQTYRSLPRPSCTIEVRGARFVKSKTIGSGALRTSYPIYEVAQGAEFTVMYSTSTDTTGARLASVNGSFSPDLSCSAAVSACPTGGCSLGTFVITSSARGVNKTIVKLGVRKAFYDTMLTSTCQVEIKTKKLPKKIETSSAPLGNKYKTTFKRVAFNPSMYAESGMGLLREVPQYMQDRACKDGYFVQNPAGFYSGHFTTPLGASTVLSIDRDAPRPDVLRISPGGVSYCLEIPADQNQLQVDMLVSVGGAQGGSPFYNAVLFSKDHPEINNAISEPLNFILGSGFYYNLPAGVYVLDLDMKPDFERWVKEVGGASDRYVNLNWRGFFVVDVAFRSTDSTARLLYNQRLRYDPRFIPQDFREDFSPALELEDFVR